MLTLSISEVDRTCEQLASRFVSETTTLVGIPRGGITAAYAIASKRRPDQKIVVRSLDDWPQSQADIDLRIGDVFLCDDIADSGRTLQQARETLAARGVYQPHIGNVTLGYKEHADGTTDHRLSHTVHRWSSDQWVVFPWENEGGQSAGPLDSVRRLIEYVGDNPERPGLQETPRRVLAFYDELKERREAEFEVTTFETSIDDIVVVKDIPFSSLCEHHMLPYHGTMSAAYLADGTVLGLSKIPRAVTAVAAGLTMQEGVTAQVAKAIQDMAKTEDVAVVSRAIHTCVTMRGPKTPGTEMMASSMHGKFRDSDMRAEFFGLIR